MTKIRYAIIDEKDNIVVFTVKHLEFLSIFNDINSAKSLLDKLPSNHRMVEIEEIFYKKKQRDEN